MKRVGIASSILLVIGFAALAGNPTPSPPPDASESRRGLVNTGSQTLGGLKTFVDGGIIATLRSGTTFEGTVILTGFSDGGSPYLVQSVRTAETTSDLTLFIDPDAGVNGRDCADASPCQTLNGALAMVPRTIRHLVTINAAPGVYPAEASIFEDFNILSGFLLVQGSMSRVTPTTGTASGTLTAVSNVAPLPLLTDSTQTWTVNEFRGRHVRMTSGSAANNIGVIISNTATALTLASPVSGTVAITDGYEIVQPAVTFTGDQTFSSVNQAVVSVRNVRGRNTATSGSSTIGRFGFSQVAIQQNGASNNSIRLSDISGPRFECIECSITGLVNSSGGATVTALSFARTFVTGPATGGTGAFSWSGGAIRSLQGPTYWRSPSGVAWRVSNNVVISIAQSTNQVIETGQTTTSAFRSTGGSILAGASGSSTGFVLICPSGSTTGVGVWLESYTIATNGVSNEFSSPIVTIQNCATGILVEGPSYFVTTGVVSHTTGTVGVSVTRGGRARLTGAPVFTGVGTELSLDGTSQTLATLNAASPQVLNTPYGSHISR